MMRPRQPSPQLKTAPGEQAFPQEYEDGRQFHRYEFRMPARATIYPPKGCEDKPVHVCEVLTRDLSRGGICFLYSKPLFQSQRVDLQLPDGRQFMLAIRRVTALRDGRFIIGCRFAKITDPNKRSPSAKR
jgi:PilZ domain